MAAHIQYVKRNDRLAASDMWLAWRRSRLTRSKVINKEATAIANRLKEELDVLTGLGKTRHSFPRIPAGIY